MARINTNYNYFHSKNKDIQKKLIDSRNYTYQSILYLIDRYFKNPGSVLDIGCGVGLVDFFLANKGFEIFGIDISSSAIELANKSKNYLNLSHIKFIVGDIGKYPISKKFDYVICSEVIEHVEDVDMLLNKIHDLSQNNAVIIISTPVVQSPLYRLGLLNSFDYEVGHLRRYSVERIIEKVEANGFYVDKKLLVEGLLRNSLYTFKRTGFLLRFVRWPVSLLVNLLDGILGKLFGFSNIYIVMRKK